LGCRARGSGGTFRAGVSRSGAVARFDAVAGRLPGSRRPATAGRPKVIAFGEQPFDEPAGHKRRRRTTSYEVSLDDKDSEPFAEARSICRRTARHTSPGRQSRPAESVLCDSSRPCENSTAGSASAPTRGGGSEPREDCS
jgi:hypothetical protein